jgi:predicted ATP-dependent protease
MSSLEGERVYHNPRRENRDRKEARTSTTREVVVHNHGRAAATDDRRSHYYSGSKWK